MDRGSSYCSTIAGQTFKFQWILKVKWINVTR